MTRFSGQRTHRKYRCEPTPIPVRGHAPGARNLGKPNAGKTYVPVSTSWRVLDLPAAFEINVSGANRDANIAAIEFLVVFQFTATNLFINPIRDCQNHVARFRHLANQFKRQRNVGRIIARFFISQTSDFIADFTFCQLFDFYNAPSTSQICTRRVCTLPFLPRRTHLEHSMPTRTSSKPQRGSNG